MDLMLMLGLTETMDQLALAYCVHLYDQVFWREDGHVLRRLEFELESHWMIDRWRKMRKR